MKWTEKETVKFVQEYIKYDCLYNDKSPGYRNRRSRHAALLNISKAMGISDFGPKEVYTKLRSLKSTYSQELRKVKASIKSGVGLDEIYIPNMKWYKILADALQAANVGGCRNTISNLDWVSRYEISQKVAGTGETEGNNGVTKIEKSSDEEASEYDVQRNSNKQVNISEKSNISGKNPRKRVLDDYDDFLKEMQKVVNSISRPVIPENEFDVFGRSIAVQLKNMPLNIAIEAEMFIQKYLSVLRLQHLCPTNNSS